MLIPLLMIAMHVLIIVMSCLQGRDAYKNDHTVWLVLFVVLAAFNVAGVVAWGAKLF